MELLRRNLLFLRLLHVLAVESQVLISRRALDEKPWYIVAGSAKPRIGKQGIRITAQRSSTTRKKNKSAHRRQVPPGVTRGMVIRNGKIRGGGAHPN